LAFFDARAFTIPDQVEVHNYFVWRQKDATRNSISMAAQAHFSHKQLLNKNTNEMQEMLWAEHGVNWNDYDPRFKRGTLVYKELRVSDVTYTDKRTGEPHKIEDLERTVWTSTAAPIFTQSDDLAHAIPALPRLTAIPVPAESAAGQ
jgi:tRNA(His) 5'-end guanylyltransferase